MFVIVEFNFCWQDKGFLKGIGLKVDLIVWDEVEDRYLRIYKLKYFISMCMYSIIYKYMVFFLKFI